MFLFVYIVPPPLDIGGATGATSFASKLPREALGELLASFRAFDADGDGAIDVNELRAAMRSLGMGDTEVGMARDMWMSMYM